MVIPGLGADSERPPAPPTNPRLSTSRRVQRQARRSGAAPPAESAPLIIDDPAEPGPAQTRKGEFLSELRGYVCAAAEEAMRGTGRITQGCPYLDYWFSDYGQRSAAEIERAIRLYAPGAAQAQSASALIPPVVDRVRAGVGEWARSGRITGVPAGLAAAVSGEPGIHPRLKASAGMAPNPTEAAAASDAVGGGRPLDSSVRQRMEGALGRDLSHVRLHTDGASTSAARRLDARA